MSLEGWKSFFEIGGVVLLLLTFAFGAGALIVNNSLNARQAAQLRQFDKDLTDAKTELGKQQVLASDAAAKVASLEGDVATAKTELAKQQTIAASAEQSLLELQQKLNWRKISAEQRRKFLAASTAKSKGLVKIIALNGDSKAKAFAEQMRALLKEAGWDSQPITTGVFIEATSVGLSLIIVSKEPPTILSKESHQVSIPSNSPVAYGVFLEKALTEAGFVLSEHGIQESPGQENSVTLVVGSQP